MASVPAEIAVETNPPPVPEAFNAEPPGAAANDLRGLEPRGPLCVYIEVRARFDALTIVRHARRLSVAIIRRRNILTIQRLEDELFFLGRFLRSPRQVASVWPSSPYLAEDMFRDLELRSGDTLVELGPGTGAFTHRVETLRARGVELQYLGIERDAALHDKLLRRFPTLDFAHGDAVDLETICQHRGHSRVAAIISGLPLMLMDDESIRRIVAGSGRVLRNDGVFRTFSYVHSYPSQGASKVRKAISDLFAEYDLGRPVVRNLPPAFVLTGRHPRPSSPTFAPSEALTG